MKVTLFDIHQAVNIETTKHWNLLTYNLPSDFPANDLQFYNPNNVVATGFAVARKRFFLATPRLFSGVPATLTSIPMEVRDTIGDSPILRAYPNWSHHTAGKGAYNCSTIGLVSVYRIRIDSCNRLWALDSGVSRSFEDSEVTCPPKILIYDLEIDQVVRRIDFPGEVLKGETLFTNMIIDETTSRPENNCDDAYIYITDTIKPAIVVYDSIRDLTWRLSHPAMYPDPNFAKPNIRGHRFTLMDGIVGVGFDARAKVMYFQPLATDRLFSIKTSVLRAGPSPFGVDLPVNLIGKKSSQGIGLAVSPIDGSIYFSPMSETAIAKYNPVTNNQSVLAYDVEQLQFVADIQIVSQNPSSIYVLSSKFHRFFLKNLDSSEINTRLMRIVDVAKHLKMRTSNQKLNNITMPNGSFQWNEKNYSAKQKPVVTSFLSDLNDKKPIPMAYKRSNGSGYKFASSYYNLKFGDFSGLRIAKSVSYNVATSH